jgi:hypothetical protein
MRSSLPFRHPNAILTVQVQSKCSSSSLYTSMCPDARLTPDEYSMSVQRDQLSEALADVSRLEPGGPLARLFRILHKTEGRQWVVKFQSAEGVSLHMGTTRLSVKKGRPGPVEDCYGFVPFERGPGEEPELCIMEVQGIGALSWPTEQEDIEVDEPAAMLDSRPVITCTFKVRAQPYAFR